MNIYKYTAERHNIDRAMIEVYASNTAPKITEVFLVATIHEDMLSPDLLSAIDNNGAVEIDIVLK